MVDTTATQILSGGTVEPVTIWAELSDGSRRPTGEQERDERNRHIWRVSAILPALGDRDKAEIITVQVASMDEPQVGNLAEPLMFDRLQVRPAVNRRSGQLALYWSAEGVRLVKAPKPQAA